MSISTLRVLKAVGIGRGKLDIVVESFNLLNHTNVTQLNTAFGNGTSPVPSFSTPIEPPSQGKFSSRLITNSGDC